ncbi:hypothetical protein L3V16_20990 [Brucella ciceri]|uniref:hypothetical protein n=1 Tax=Brucella ciceri TaxID=391287 RepID=UPI000DE27FF1|nr:hypothetical protein [Brucella ciceri]MCH6206303.1 hypothetical protein [Brucella ciceri]
MSNLFPNKFLLDQPVDYEDVVSFILKGNVLRVAFTGNARRVKGLQTARVELNDAASALVSFYIDVQTMAQNPVSQWQPEFRALHNDVQNILMDACDHEIWRLKSREGHVGNLEVHVVQLPGSLMSRYDLSQSAAILSISRGGKSDYAHLSVGHRSGRVLNASMELKGEAAVIDEIALAIVLAEVAVEDFYRAAA